MITRSRHWPLLAAVWAVLPAAAQESGEVTIDVERCVDLESESERRACFAAEVDAALAVRESTETRVPGPAEAAAAPDEQAADTEEILATIVEMEERLPSAYVIRLDNGQIWQQTEPKRYPLRPGLEVRIYATRWGYRLSGIDTGGNIQVRRVQ